MEHLTLAVVVFSVKRWMTAGMRLFLIIIRYV